MKLIVGLGNPGSEYTKTRHNIGFSLLDYLAKIKGFSFDKDKFNGMYAEYMVNGEKVILVKPLSYMNLSGGVVYKYINFFKIDIKDLLIIQDDLDMTMGKIKFVYNSSSGGHNGIKDIEKYLKTKEYARLKIGIAHNKDIDTKDYVLGKFNEEESKILNHTFEKLDNVIEDFCKLDLNLLMTKYNNK